MKPDNVVRAKVYNEDISVSATLFFNYPQSHSDPVEYGVLFDNYSDVERMFSHKYMQGGRAAIFQLRGSKNSSAHDIWIPRISINNFQKEHFDQSYRGQALLFFEGDLTDLQKEETLNCYIYLQPNSLNNEFYTNREVPPVSWITPFGQAEFIFMDESGGDSRGNKSSIINIKISSEDFSSLEDLLIKLSDYLNDIMLLISFLCKKYIHWYEIDVWRSSSGKHPHLIRGYSDPSSVKYNPSETSGLIHSAPGNLLVDLQVLQTAVGQSVFSNYVNHEKVSIVKQLMAMVMATHLGAFVDQDLGVIYTALETLVSEFSNLHEVLEERRSKKLRRAIREMLADPKYELTTKEIEEIDLKLPELNRYSYKTKLISLFEKKLESLPELEGRLNGELLINMLKAAISRRNIYIHTGKIIGDHTSDIALVRFFISLWVLDCLNYPLGFIRKYDSDLLLVELASKIERR